MNRFAQADATQSAVNPVALVNTLKTWIQQVQDEGGDFNAIRNDPACRLLMYQLAYLFGVDALGQDDYETLLAECQRKGEEN